MSDPQEIDRAVAIVDALPDFRLLRRIGPSSDWNLPGAKSNCRHGLFIDVETTGLDLESDEIIEIALLLFSYDPHSGEVLEVFEAGALNELRDPGMLIPAESQQIHGITDDQVKGKVVNETRLTALVADADLIFAHNAAFDRPMLERIWPVFAEMPWACSLTDIDWRAEGFGAGKLDYILLQQGWFFEGHRALHDCLAGTFLLTLILPKSGRRTLVPLLESARREQTAIRAVGAPFDAKDILRKRGYRWDPGSGGREKAWWIIVEEVELETSWLRDKVFGQDVRLPTEKVDARNRFSERIWDKGPDETSSSW